MYYKYKIGDIVHVCGPKEKWEERKIVSISLVESNMWAARKTGIYLTNVKTF